MHAVLRACAPPAIQARQAADTIADIERRVSEDSGRHLPEAEGQLDVHPGESSGFALIARAMLHEYPSRSLLAPVPMTAQALLFNAVLQGRALRSRAPLA
jgi:hypothetical protein